MRVRVLPGRRTLVVLAGCTAGVLALLLAGFPASWGSAVAAGAVFILLTAAFWDYRASRAAWRAAGISLERQLPAAFAIGVKRTVPLAIAATEGAAWHCTVFDRADPSLRLAGLPLTLTIAGRTRTSTSYDVTPTTRGDVTFAAADVRVRSRWGLCELVEPLGSTEVRRVYPDFAQVARYAWLAGDRRLQEIGIKTYQMRGQGTDFKQLAEYRPGNPVRHIDWRATLRVGKPIVREFQDERDQCVMVLLDCGRRMRADDRSVATGTTHFDQVLNAVMLLSYVALKQGDAVGAMTFGTAAGEERSFAPRKGVRALNALMGQLSDVRPDLTHSDYVAVAEQLLRSQRKRALVVVVTNFRDEDSAELSQALRLLRSRHLVLLASLRERIVDELLARPIETNDAVIDIASARLYEQARTDAFQRLAASDVLMVDADPDHLGIQLVNRYHAVKRAGLI